MSETEKRAPKPNTRALEFDLFAQLSYMSALSTAGVSRGDLFAYAAKLPYSTSVYFKKISVAAKKLNIDYAEACRIEAERTSAPDVRSLLLRLAGSLTAGEDETEFLRREAQVIGETYGNRYSREVESLKKWTDAYVALIVAASLIVIVAVISMMVYPVGVGVVVGLALAMITAACLGGLDHLRKRSQGVQDPDQGAQLQASEARGVPFQDLRAAGHRVRLHLGALRSRPGLGLGVGRPADLSARPPVQEGRREPDAQGRGRGDGGARAGWGHGSDRHDSRRFAWKGRPPLHGQP